MCHVPRLSLSSRCSLMTASPTPYSLIWEILRDLGGWGGSPDRQPFCTFRLAQAEFVPIGRTFQELYPIWLHGSYIMHFERLTLVKPHCKMALHNHWIQTNLMKQIKEERIDKWFEFTRYIFSVRQNNMGKLSLIGDQWSGKTTTIWTINS